MAEVLEDLLQNMRTEILLKALKNITLDQCQTIVMSQEAIAFEYTWRATVTVIAALTAVCHYEFILTCLHVLLKGCSIGFTFCNQEARACISKSRNFIWSTPDLNAPNEPAPQNLENGNFVHYGEVACGLQQQESDGFANVELEEGAAAPHQLPQAEPEAPEDQESHHKVN